VGLDHAVAHGKGHDLGAVLNVQLVQDVAKVIFDGVFGDHPSLSEFAIASNALHEQVEHFALPPRERVETAALVVQQRSPRRAGQ
jgi:hypothetical protein